MAALKPYVDDLETELTCSICQEIFQEPKTLSCLHNFCSKCIAQWYERSGNPVTKRFDCPICKARIDVPDGDISKLRSSFYLDSLLQILKAMRAKSDQHQPGLSVCMSCEGDLELVAFCVQCNGLICSECLNSHKRVKHLREEHQVKMLNDFKQENVDCFVKNQMFCQEKFHQRNKLEYYCKEENCKKCVCQQCATLNHQNHDMLGIDEAGEQGRQSTMQEMERVSKVKEKCEQELAQSKSNMDRIENEHDLATQKVKDVAESIVKKARDHEATMIKELNEKLTEQRKVNQEERSDIEAKINELAKFLLRAQTLLDKSAASEIVIAQEDLQQRCQSYSERPSILSSKPIQRNVTLRYMTNQQVTQSLQNVGRIVESVTDPLHCTIESLKEVRCGFVNDFVVMTRNSEDELCHTDKGSIDVRIQDTEGNEVESRMIEETTGKYNVSYRAEKAVEYELQVNIAGQPIKNSPQKIKTLDSKLEFTHVKSFLGVKKGEQSFKTISVSNIDNMIAVNDRLKQCVNVFDLEGNLLRSFETVDSEIPQDKDLNFVPFKAVFIEDKLIICVLHEKERVATMEEFDLNGASIRTICTSDPPFNCLFIVPCLDDDLNIAVCCWRPCEDGAIKPCIKLISKQGHLIRDFEDIEDNEKPCFITYNNGKYFVSYTEHHRIRVFDKSGVFLNKFGEEGVLGGQFKGVFGLTGYGPDMILVCDGDNNRVQLLTTDGEFITSFSEYGSDVMDLPVDIAVGADGKVFVVQVDGTVQIWR